MDIQEEIKSALESSSKGMTARQLMDHCETAADLNAVVKVIHTLKAEGKVRADGMRESQVVYKLGAWPGSDLEPSKPVPNIPEIIPAQVAKAKRTAAGLRDGLFEMLEALKSGKVDAKAAQSYAQLSMTILKSLEVQMQYEKMVRAKELPEALPDLELVPEAVTGRG